jgi:putative RNA 2'-phosphotransferase
MDDTRLSKIISLALRHEPKGYDIVIGQNGWTSIEEFITGIRKKHPEFKEITIGDLERVVNLSHKKRHEIKEDQIRALFGHSIAIEKADVISTPPKYLYHGTSYKNYLTIKSQGLKRMQRQFVHMHVNKLEAEKSASRKFKPAITLKVNSKKAFDEGILFYQEGDVWLAEQIPAKYIDLI